VLPITLSSAYGNVMKELILPIGKPRLFFYYSNEKKENEMLLETSIKRKE